MKHKRLAAWLWLSQIQYFIVQGLVTMAWNKVAPHFSLRRNPISDLGNTAVGLYDGRYVNSPRYPLMNASFVVLGIAMAAGALLLIGSTRATRHKIGFGLLAIGGFGTILVGLFPENSIGVMHTLGAGLPFVLGNIALLLLATEPRVPLWLHRATYIFAPIALVSLLAFISGTTWLLGSGGFERLTAYTQTIWMMAFGLVLLRRKQ